MDCWGERPHLCQGDRVVSFAGLRRGAAAKARQLRASGVGSGDKVMLLGWNSPDWVINFWACVQIGAIPVLANAWWGQSEIDYALELIKPSLILADATIKVEKLAGQRLGAWAADETVASIAVPDAPDPDGTPKGENDTAIIVFTSGTEGRAKAVVLPHRALLSGLQMMLDITRQLPLEFDPERTETVLHTGPLFHIGGPQIMLRSVAVGNTLVFTSGRFDPGEVVDLIARHRVNRWSAVPTMLTRVLDHPDEQNCDLSSLQSIGTGGTPVSADLVKKLRNGLSGATIKVALGYGMTENTGPATTASAAETEKYPGTCGRPLKLVEVQIAPREGLPDGEVLVRAPTLMSGYYGVDDSPIDKDGFLHTGDLGRMDDTGRLWITGRSKEMIIRGGENIAPSAVEAAVAALPAVAEVAVFGVPHADLGEEVMAVVVARDAITVQDLRDQLKGKLASFSIPTRWHLRTQPLPTNQTGKVDKKAVKQMALGEIQDASS
jgi:acyl-CoA synthetase (AMP-forming)/AMP-acid ligase II